MAVLAGLRTGVDARRTDRRSRFPHCPALWAALRDGHIFVVAVLTILGFSINDTGVLLKE